MRVRAKAWGSSAFSSALSFCGPHRPRTAERRRDGDSRRPQAVDLGAILRSEDPPPALREFQHAERAGRRWILGAFGGIAKQRARVDDVAQAEARRERKVRMSDDEDVSVAQERARVQWRPCLV